MVIRRKSKFNWDFLTLSQKIMGILYLISFILIVAGVIIKHWGSSSEPEKAIKKTLNTKQPVNNGW